MESLGTRSRMLARQAENSSTRPDGGQTWAGSKLGSEEGGTPHEHRRIFASVAAFDTRNGLDADTRVSGIPE